MTDIVERLWQSDEASALTNEAAREIERLRGLSADADLRLRAAGFRVGVYAGSDTPEYLADEIERLRDRVNAMLSERLA